MKNLFRGIAGAFVELEPEQTAASTAPTAAVTSAAPPATPRQVYGGVQPTAAAPTAYLPTHNLNPDMVTLLTNVSIKRATAYTTFLTAATKLDSLGLDENTKLKAAFLQVTGDGRSVENICQAIDVHISDLDGEASRFSVASEANQRQQVEAVRAQAQSRLQDNEKINQQISELQNQIASLTATLQINSDAAQNLTNQAAAAEQQVAQVKEDFAQALVYVKQSLVDKKAMLQSVAATITK